MLDPLEECYAFGRFVLIRPKKNLNDTRNHSLALKSMKKNSITRQIVIVISYLYLQISDRHSSKNSEKTSGHSSA
jgi:hypothetical protein